MWVETHNSCMPRVSEATKAEHRERLLAAAATEFAARGLQGARVDDISLAAGLAKGTIYNYFDSKEHVFREVIAHWWNRVAMMREPLAVDASTRDQLLAIVCADIAVMGEMEEFARTAFREVLLRSGAAAEALLPSWDPLGEEVERVIEVGQSRAELRSDRSVEELVRFFAATVNGMLVEHWLPGSELSLEELPEMIIDFYFVGAGS